MATYSNTKTLAISTTNNPIFTGTYPGAGGTLNQSYVVPAEKYLDLSYVVFQAGGGAFPATDIKILTSTGVPCESIPIPAYAGAFYSTLYIGKRLGPGMKISFDAATPNGAFLYVMGTLMENQA